MKHYTKNDEMEKHHSDKAARNGFKFYLAALLIWSIYDQVKSGGFGDINFAIMMGGVAVYFGSRAFYNRKTR